MNKDARVGSSKGLIDLTLPSAFSAGLIFAIADNAWSSTDISTDCPVHIALKTSPVLSTETSGMLSLPTETEEGEDKELTGKIVDGKGKKLTEVEDEIDDNEE